MPLLRDIKTFSGIVTSAFDRRRNQSEWDRFAEQRGPVEENFGAAIFFPDGPVNVYQLRQWYEPMRHLAERRPVAVLVRNVSTANLLKDECPLPVLLQPQIGLTEQWLAEHSVGAVFYVNQNIVNFRMMRFRDPAHIFISHGESDKDYMASNQLKAYDHTFIAGQAAYDRIGRRLVDFDREAHLRRIGRPQVDVKHSGPALPDDHRTVVLYAPTWEGDRPSMQYSSLGSHAPGMLDVLLTTGQHRVVYRPHPRTGAFDPSFRELHDEVVRKIEAANEADPDASHVVDTDSVFGWHLAAADVCVCDISAVAFDFLATGKPLLLTEPAAAAAEVDRDGLPGLLRTFRAEDASDVLTVIEAVRDGGDRERYGQIVEHYFGDTTPGVSLRTFLDVSSEIIDRRQKLATEAI
ncbi:CDP-glycerol:poly(glycerophosphate) glycerophosphotransferase [Isoptericola jiangsuensis]|uniref:CDP-glycerol:poly(Glycerophosphate) glycerophosphotransferase n=1 Tax=Isoptericola jiangsuensis TaxID=548579 RepID=A0A2A9F0U6_9MICO|nr:CDP-glycerol glycerophosphotransferase family protein [Isoptericola jiangsuensis]PFG44049.1 CDP-glycerol:poly(glycerophosphate) glycerophosphotransferase [Isoptericola jiangsuensis]